MNTCVRNVTIRLTYMNRFMAASMSQGIGGLTTRMVRGWWHCLHVGVGSMLAQVSQFAQVLSTSLSHFETLVSPLDWCIGVIVYKYRKRELPRAGYAMQF
jgi:hypothetical protein